MSVRPSTRWAALAVACALATGCASTPPPAGGVADPWQRMNRPVFAFNLKVDDYVLRPVARGWTAITFEQLRDALARFHENLRFPSRFVSSVGQGKPVVAATEVGRFVVNSTVGIAGFFDPASKIGLPRGDEDIGQMFGRWGIPPGPYWVIPLLGPSDPRDAVGMACDAMLNPLSWFVPLWASLTNGAVNVVNSRARADKQIENARRTALDFYVFVRDAYIQSRDNAVRDSAPAGSGTNYDLYDAGGSDSGVYDLPQEPNQNAPP